MDKKEIGIIAQIAICDDWQVENTILLLEDKATIPFISRYRKEATGGLDEVKISQIKQEYNRLSELKDRKNTIIKTIEEQGKLTSELHYKISNTYNSIELEDIYLPYKPKKRSRAEKAKEKGLEPLADKIYTKKCVSPEKEAKKYLSEEVKDTDEALQGARDIIAEKINEDTATRNIIRNIFKSEAFIKSKVIKDKETEAIKYKDYFKFEENLNQCPSHRLLAMRRGEEEGFLRVSISPPEDSVLNALSRIYLKNNNPKCNEQIETAAKDGYKRLLQPSIETEFNNISKAKADKEAIKVFADNLRQLLMAAPLGHKRVLALDPGYRSGCKLVCLNKQGSLLYNTVIYPHPPQSKKAEAAKTLNELIKQFKIEVIAVGNGTASRETETFAREEVKKFHNIPVFSVSENGASVYSASKIAREEFPEQDVTVRGAVSIGRRLIDPLAELVKIDPKSIGVGQYQHAVNQNALKESLDEVVESCVNSVGVNVNTASKHLLTHISGISATLAQNIVDYRNQNGAFKSRKELMKVPRMGNKSFEQSAGFLRIADAKNPLDASAVHPESYNIVEQMAKDLNCTVGELLKDEQKRKKINPHKYINKKTGLPTIKDILNELSKPGLDPREKITAFKFSDKIHSIEDLEEGMIVAGIISNITNFGAFVDIGIKQDGLIHISNLCDKYVSSPADVVKLQQKVEVKVIEIDIARKRIGLSMKGVAQK